MNTTKKLKIDTKTLLSSLWIFAVLNYLYADVLSLMNPERLNEFLTGTVGGISITPAFLFFGAQRLDGENEISFFILLIPVWIFILPLFAYIILNGVAAQNTRIAPCEKVILSLLVPLGFTLTLILLIWYYDNSISDRKYLKMIFMPHLLSLFCLYLYLRCLVRPVRVQNLNSIPQN